MFPHSKKKRLSGAFFSVEKSKKIGFIPKITEKISVLPLDTLSQNRYNEDEFRRQCCEAATK